MEHTLSFSEEITMDLLFSVFVCVFSTAVSIAILTVVFGDSGWTFYQQSYATTAVAILTVGLIVWYSPIELRPHSVTDFFNGILALIVIPFVFYLCYLFVYGALVFTIWTPLVSLIEYGTTIPVVTSTLVLGLGGLSVGAILITAKKTGPAVDLSLILQMVVSLFILAALTIWFLNIIRLFIQSFVWSSLSPVVTVFTLGLGVMLAYSVYRVEFVDFTYDERHGDATPVSSTEFPTIHSIMNKVAIQLDIPMPTLAITEQSEPVAVTVGYRPGNIYLILSQGTLDALNEDELEAVIAHELAHAANMDAMVMTIASLPALLARTFIVKYAKAIAEVTSSTVVMMLIMLITSWLVVFALITAALSRPALAVLSRTREWAADRTAATVTGSPLHLASALRTLDDRIAETPSEDLREAASLSALSILPLRPTETETDQTEGDQTEAAQNIDTGEKSQVPTSTKWWRHAGQLLFATHPPTDRRIDALTALTEEQRG